jgi:hypothetical protein
MGFLVLFFRFVTLGGGTEGSPWKKSKMLGRDRFAALRFAMVPSRKKIPVGPVQARAAKEAPAAPGVGAGEKTRQTGPDRQNTAKLGSPSGRFLCL